MSSLSENEPPPLKPGDVLLFHGHGFVSWAIRRFDEADVDHAAVVLDPETMAEATASGLRHVAVEPAVDGNAFTYVRRLPDGIDTSPVIDRALAFESSGVPITHERLAMLAMLAMMRRLPIGEPTLRRLLCVLLERASGIVDRLRARGRRLVADSEFVYRCFVGTNEPTTMLEVFSPRGHRPGAIVDLPRPSLGEDMLWEWAAGRPEPRRGIARWPREPLEPLIAAFARKDSPNDPIVPRSYVADAAAVEPLKRVDDEQLHAAAVRFRDAVLRLEPEYGSPESEPEHPWGTFRAVANVVTAGDLRYSHSLQSVTSFRPSVPPARAPAGQGCESESAGR